MTCRSARPPNASGRARRGSRDIGASKNLKENQNFIEKQAKPEARGADRFTKTSRNKRLSIPGPKPPLLEYCLRARLFEAQLILGTSYMDGREWAKAEEALNRALALRSDSAPPLLSLGEVYWRQKRYNEAEKALQDGLKLDDKSWRGYFTLGRLYWDKGEVAKAAPPTGKTLQLKPDFAEAHLLAGNILLRLGQQERALVEYQEYLRLAPKGEFAAQTRELAEKLKTSLATGKKK